MRWRGCRPLAALVWALTWVSGSTFAEDHKPWDDPNFNRPENAQKRQDLEFTDMFNHQVARPPRSLRFLKSHPDAYQKPEGIPPTLLLGDLLFHASRLLGERPAYFGLSCASCHPGGAATTDIFVGAGSDRAGNIDLLSDYFTPFADDGIYAPRNVPSLRGIRYTGPYERDGSKSSLAEVIAGVVGREFNQPLRPDWLNALELYVSEIDFLPNPQIDAFGRLTAKASPAAHRGEVLFQTPRPQFDGLACAGCHLPESFYTDHRVHRFHHGVGEDISTPEEAFVTPTLINSSESPPYFFDGSAPTLAEAIKQINERSQLGLTAEEKGNLTAFVEAVGAAEAPRVPSLKERFEESLAYLVLLDQPTWSEDAQLWSLCLDTVRHELRGAVRAAEPKLRLQVEPAVRDYEGFVASPKGARPSPEARAELHRLRARLWEVGSRTKPAAKSAAAHAER
jgi:cytochrome c peroxidase